MSHVSEVETLLQLDLVVDLSGPSGGSIAGAVIGQLHRLSTNVCWIPTAGSQLAGRSR